MALYASKIISYAQGYALMNAMAKDSGWEINNGGVALMWRGGCIIRSAFLGKIKEAFDHNPKLANLLLDPYFTGEINRAQAGWRRVVAAASMQGIPVPCMASALSYYDGYRLRPAPRQPAPGPARLLRRPHLRAGRQAPRRVLPHQLDRSEGGTTASTHLQRLNDPACRFSARRLIVFRRPEHSRRRFAVVLRTIRLTRSRLRRRG